jgi:hypothetical protein
MSMEEGKQVVPFDEKKHLGRMCLTCAKGDPELRGKIDTPTKRVMKRLRAYGIEAVEHSSKVVRVKAEDIEHLLERIREG